LRFTILLPTRNGGVFLADALDSILRQAGDFEVVVGDNANEDATAEVLSLRAADQRLRVVRSERLLSVSDNWTSCLRAARGRYMLMIGDDDLLLPDFFPRIETLLARHGEPECLTFDAYSYVAPSSFADDAPALWAPRHFDTRRLGGERELAPAERRQIVRDMFRFRVRFPLNMQLTLFSRDAVAAIPGEFFRAPFPDHFALNSMLLRAPRFVVTSERLLVVGVSPKSFGHYFYGGQQTKGTKYLGSSASFPGLLEGSELVNSMFAWLLELRRTYPELQVAHISRWGYAARQTNFWLRQAEFGKVTWAELRARLRRLRPWELVTVALPIIGYRLFRHTRAVAQGRRLTYLSDSWPALRPSPHASIREFATNLPPA
jgi:glycosyltransferase involved in cell wall biosynthesis